MKNVPKHIFYKSRTLKFHIGRKLVKFISHVTFQYLESLKAPHYNPGEN